MIKIFCDKCDEQIREERLVRIKHTFSYGSPRDGDTIELDLCEDCLQDILSEL